jgi:hypothetical protein
MSKKRKIALYNTEYGTSIREATNWIENDDEYVRVSEIVEVYIKPLIHEDITNKRVKMLKKQKRTIQAECEVKLQQIDVNISNLLAITHDGATNE